MTFKKFLFFIILIFCFCLAQAHPHLFIKSSFDLIISNNNLKGIKVIWNWDKWWSEEVIRECDLDKNGAFNAKETELIYKDFFSAIRDFNYFTRVYVHNKEIKVRKVENFKARIEKDKTVTYEFVIPINAKLNKQSFVELFFNDNTIYTAFDRNAKAIKTTNLKDLNIETYSYYGIKISFIYSL